MNQKMDKQQLRSQIRQVLKQLARATVQRQSHSIASLASDLQCLESKTGVSVYLARQEQEVQTNALIRTLLDRGFRVFAPCILSFNEPRMEMLELRRDEDVNLFELDKWGIPVLPNPHERIRARFEDIDVVFTPGVAFDMSGRRMGNGRGYYDTFFHECDAWRSAHGLARCLKIGLALDEMVQPPNVVPMETHDVLLDVIVTPSAISRKEQDGYVVFENLTSGFRQST